MLLLLLLLLLILQVQHVSVAYGVPRFVSVKLYVPEAEQGLPDWEVLDGNNIEQVKGHHTP